MYSTKQKKNLVEDISSLDKNELLNVFNIIKKFTKKFTINDNGIFINLSILNDDAITNLIVYVNECKENRKKLEEETIKTIINNVKNDEENKEDDKNDDDKIEYIEKYEEEEIENKEEENDDEIDGTKIVLKKMRPKYNGIRAKIIKNCKMQKNTKTIPSKNIKHKNYKKEKAEVYEIEEENFTDDINNYEELDINEEEIDNTINDNSNVVSENNK